MGIAKLIYASFLLLVISVIISCEKSDANEKGPAKTPPGFNPLEDLILNQGKGGFEPGAALSRVKRQYRRYPYPIPIIVGGGFGVYGGRGFGGRGFGGKGFGGRGFGGRGFGGGRGGFGGGRGGRG